MSKRYDQAYFDRWYRGSKHGRDSKALLTRKVQLAVSLTEYYLERPIRSVIDVGCGEAPWRAALLKLRPGLHYQGVESSEYAVRRYGKTRNIALAHFAQLEHLRLGPPADLLICSDVLHYLDARELRAGLRGFGELCHGLAFLETFTREDEIVGDLKGLYRRPARWYREALAAEGFIACGSHAYLSPSLPNTTCALERIAP